MMSMFAARQELTAEQRLSKEIVAIMNDDRHVALAGLLMVANWHVSDDIPTACTNGRDVWFGRAFMDTLTDAELRFVILHELYHIIYRHLITWKYLHDRNHKCANHACDYVINLQIADAHRDGFATLPKGALYDERFRDMDAEQVFNILYEEDDGSGGGDGDDEGGGLDDHDWEGAEEMDEDEKRKLVNDIDEALRQGAITAGKMGSGGNRAVDELLQPEVDWREVLREFITATCVGSDYSTYAKPNRRYLSSGRYMPSGISERVEELVIAIDTSGSIGQAELTKFLSEVQGVVSNVRPEKVRLLYWDTGVCADEEYDETNMDRLIESTKPDGGGGTDVNCVTQYMQEKQISAQAVIVFTDGWLYGGWGTWSQPVLWCVLDNKSAKPTVGKTVHVKL